MTFDAHAAAYCVVRGLNVIFILCHCFDFSRVNFKTYIATVLKYFLFMDLGPTL